MFLVSNPVLTYLLPVIIAYFYRTNLYSAFCKGPSSMISYHYFWCITDSSFIHRAYPQDSIFHRDYIRFWWDLVMSI